MTKAELIATARKLVAAESENVTVASTIRILFPYKTLAQFVTDNPAFVMELAKDSKRIFGEEGPTTPRSPHEIVLIVVEDWLISQIE